MEERSTVNHHKLRRMNDFSLTIIWYNSEPGKNSIRYTGSPSIVWNTIPKAIRDALSLQLFKGRPNTLWVKERKTYCTFATKLLTLIKFMKGCDKQVTATERMKAQTQQTNENKTIRTKKCFKKRKEKLLMKGNSILIGKCRDA